MHEGVAAGTCKRWVLPLRPRLSPQFKRRDTGISPEVSSCAGVDRARHGAGRVDYELDRIAQWHWEGWRGGGELTCASTLGPPSAPERSWLSAGK